MGGYQFNKRLSVLLFLRAADDGKDQYVEESEVTPCETRAEETFPLQKPVTRVRSEARPNSIQVTRNYYCSYRWTEFIGSTRSSRHQQVVFCTINQRNIASTEKESSSVLWAVLPRREEAHRLHSRLQEVQSTGGKEVHL